MYSTKPMAAAILLPYLCLIHSVVVVASVTELGRIRCIEREGRALLEFKKNLIDDYGRLSSWTSHDDKATDCCEWDHVYCSNFTNHVIRLDLQGQGVTGNLTSSLLVLEHLVYLDLSGNFFEGKTIPGFIGSLQKLRFLNLSSSQFSGEVPFQLKNLSSLQYLDLSYNYHLSSKDPMAWLSSLSSLGDLTLANTNLSQATGWAKAITNLPSLRYLDLSASSLPDETPSSLVHTNLSNSLVFVDLSRNSLSGRAIYPWLFNLSNLIYLDLSKNQLDSGIPNSFQRLCQLSTLDISYNTLTQDLVELFKCLSGCPEKSLEYLQLDSNSLTGSLPDFTMFSSLVELHISSNKLNGTFPSMFQQISPLSGLDMYSNQLTGSLPDLSVFPSLTYLSLQNNGFNGTVNEGIGKLSMLETLDLSGNSLKCKITEAHLSNLSSLSLLFLSNNSMVLDISANWTPPFMLHSLDLAYCKLGPGFPRWLQNWGSLSYLDISYAGISDSMPGWFWNVFIGAGLLWLSNNRIHGILPDSPVQFQNSPTIYLSNNSLEGPIPTFFRAASSLDISKNKLSGPFPPFLCEVGDGLAEGIERSIIDFSDNSMSGELPDCWKQGNGLTALALANNNFSGKIPASLGFLQNLKVLQLRNNRFHGKLPSSLKRCTHLIHVDATNNFLSGEVPAWIGNSLPQLVVLSLRNNSFKGIIPPQLCKLSLLQILDLSSNTISGTIPHCLSDLSAMVVLSSGPHLLNFTCLPLDAGYFDYAYVMWKGSEREYQNTLALVMSIDLSSNRLDGEIPSDLSNLTGLISLNLSRNRLEGTLNAKLGRLKSLEILDLSRNRLSGEIPTSFSDMGFLSTLDLSYNNLSGRIPTGTQLQNCDAASFAGNNPGLCGDPLPKMCPGDERPEKDDGTHEEEEDSFVSTGLYVSVGLGFATGFWGICGTLIFSRTMKYAYFWILDRIYDRLYLIMVKFHGWR